MVSSSVSRPASGCLPTVPLAEEAALGAAICSGPGAAVSSPRTSLAAVRHKADAATNQFGTCFFSTQPESRCTTTNCRTTEPVVITLSAFA